MTEHVNLARIRAKPGKSDQLGEALLALVEPSRAEPGCIAYVVHHGIDDRDLWMVYEAWQSAADLRDHFELPHMQAFVARIPDLVEGELDLAAFQGRGATTSLTGDKRERGEAVIRTLNEGAGQPALEALRQDFPGLADAITGFALGEIWARPVLDHRTRQLAAVSAFAALGNQAYLKIHAGYALNMGVSEEDLKEVVYLTTVHAGFPRAIDAAQTLASLFAERRSAQSQGKE